jgi:transposase
LTHSAGSADEEGPGWNDDPRLCSARHDHAVRGAHVLDGTVIGQCMARHRHQEFIGFLNRIEAAVPAGKLIHAILDNYAAHKHSKVRAWLVRHPRWVFHFTPTSCSWANAVETFFASLTHRRLQRGVFRSLVDLQAAINRSLGEHNRKPKPFVWTADPNRMIEKLNRGYRVLASDHWMGSRPSTRMSVTRGAVGVQDRHRPLIFRWRRQRGYRSSVHYRVCQWRVSLSATALCICWF